MNTPSLLPVHDWHIDTTDLRVALRFCAEGSPDGSVTAGEHGFVLTAEHARQVIRDLSAAVLASDLEKLLEGPAGAS
ncbi:hypothetical protein SAMN02787142_7787 [Burkholderia sp. WP9]|nr:hypothetical protein SAMN02787142_7787 [Burkholderia sp. WP9]